MLVVLALVVDYLSAGCCPGSLPEWNEAGFGLNSEVQTCDPTHQQRGSSCTVRCRTGYLSVLDSNYSFVCEQSTHPSWAAIDPSRPPRCIKDGCYTPDNAPSKCLHQGPDSLYLCFSLCLAVCVCARARARVRVCAYLPLFVYLSLTPLSACTKARATHRRTSHRAMRSRSISTPRTTHANAPGQRLADGANTARLDTQVTAATNKCVRRRPRECHAASTEVRVPTLRPALRVAASLGKRLQAEGEAVVQKSVACARAWLHRMARAVLGLAARTNAALIGSRRGTSRAGRFPRRVKAQPARRAWRRPLSGLRASSMRSDATASTATLETDAR